MRHQFIIIKKKNYLATIQSENIRNSPARKEEKLNIVAQDPLEAKALALLRALEHIAALNQDQQDINRILRLQGAGYYSKQQMH